MLTINLFNLLSLHFYLVLILSLFNIFILYIFNYKLIKNYQLSGYNLNKTYQTLCENKYEYLISFINFTLLVFCSMFAYNSLVYFVFKNIYLTYIGILFYFIFTYIFFRDIIKNTNKKNKLIITKRIMRFLIVFSVINFVFTFALIYLSYSVTNFFLIAILSFTPIISLLSFGISHFLVMPIEMLVNSYYKNTARNRLKKYPNLKVVGITGSFAKTSVKNILYSFLSQQFNVLKTPSSFNTEMGICKFINNSKLDNCDFLILEMGADKNHDILKLCKIAKPHHAILTGINNQHLNTFKTLDNIINTKYELIENTEENGILIFNGESEICKTLFEKTKRENKFLITLNNNKNIYAKDINYENGKMNFTLCYKNEEIEVSTFLLGEHNVLNILLASFLALKLGAEIKDLKIAINKLKPTPHRLELIKQNDLNIIDDSFNSNPTGAKLALKVLKNFKGNKIVITPGLVELGIYQPVENENLGEEIGEIADFVYVVNKTNKEALLKGLNKTIESSKIKYYDTLNEVQNDLKTITKIGDTILFLNDLPDNYE